MEQSAPAPQSTQRAGVVLLWLAVLAMASLGLANCWFALHAPFELEIREGTAWLYVLTEDAGRSLYDYSHVAFLNMNHGPLGPVFTWWLHRLLPWLGPAQVVRAFVALLPFGLLALFRYGTRSWLAGAAWATGFYLVLLGFGPVQFLIGRSDPAALLFLASLIGVAQAMRRNLATSSRPQWLAWGAVIGLLAVTTVLLNWRYAPAAVVVAVGFGLEAWTEAPSARSFGGGGQLILGAVAVTVAILAAVLATLFHGDAMLYYQHFFGVFTRDSGWGAQGRMPFEFFPSELRDGLSFVHLGLCLAAIIAMRKIWVGRTGRLKVVTWLALFAALWIATTWGFFLNHGAGGIHYYAPFYLIAFYFVATRAPWAALPNRTIVLLAVLFLSGLSWETLWAQAHRLRDVTCDGRAFAKTVERIAAGETVYSEDVHLFKHHYRGEVIDVGDMVEQVAAKPFFPEPFRALVRNHSAELAAHPPNYVLASAQTVISPTLAALLRERYVVVAKSPPIILAQDLPVALYRLRSK